MQKPIRLVALSSIAILNLLFGAALVFGQPEVANTKSNKPATLEQTIRSSTAVKDTSTPTGDSDTATDDLGVTNEFGSSLRIRLPEQPEADPTLVYEIFEDFVNGGGHTPLEKINQLASAGGGSGQGWRAGPVYEDAWGVIEAHHGTGSYSRLDLVGKSNYMYGVAVGMGTAYEYQVRFNIANLSNETNRYIAFDGFFDGDTVDPTFNRGILFRYSDDINDGRFQVVVRASEGVETLVDTGIAPVPNTWYRLKICVNSTGTEAKFFIDGAEVATVTTNLAIGPTNRYTAESNNDRLSGNTDFVSRRYDYVRFRAVGGRRSRL